MEKIRPITDFKFSEAEYAQFLAGIEIFRPIEYYEGHYEISTFGRIKSLGRFVYNGGSNYGRKRFIRDRILKQRYDKDGYLTIRISINSITKTYRVHRLCAIEFVNNPLLKPEVNHIRGNKSIVSVNDLEWVTSSENSIHAFSIGLRTPNSPWIGKFGINHIKSRPIIRLSNNNEIIDCFESAIDAKNRTGIDNSHISKCARGLVRQAGGYKWKFA